MPVYIPKRTNRAPSLDSFIEGDEDESDYLQDPEMNIDLLPQPFRMIDKLMRDIIDDSLEIALAREASRLLENDRYKPPQHNCAKELHVSPLVKVHAKHNILHRERVPCTKLFSIIFHIESIYRNIYSINVKYSIKLVYECKIIQPPASIYILVIYIFKYMLL